MEILNKKNLLRWYIWGLVCTGFLSCSETEEGAGQGINENESVPVFLETEETTDAPELSCSLYIFSKGKGTDSYRLNQMLSPAIGAETLLPLKGKELKGYDFRFLFVATPHERNEIKVADRNGQAATGEIAWEDIVLAMATDSLTIHNYYGITEMSGNEIIESGRVEGHLQRLTGQIVFNFYKAGPGGADDPIALDSTLICSVFDRIYQVDITYTGYAGGVGFGAENALEPIYKEEKALQQTYRFMLTPDLQVEVPQPDNQLYLYQSLAGSVHLPGACFLPTDRHLHIAMVFHYYDTTPVCGITDVNSNHSHTTVCYTSREVRLDLPALPSDGLSVKPDYFTVNKAGLPCDRVIDIKHISGAHIQTSWNLYNSN